MSARQKLGYNQERVLTILRGRPDVPLNLYQLNDLMGDCPGTRHVIQSICESLVRRGDIVSGQTRNSYNELELTYRVKP